MPLEVDYLPVAVAGGANVDSQANFVGSGYQTGGFQAGLAQSKQLNKVWRQSSMMAAALANFIANTLGINVLDDGNISALIANLTQAILITGERVQATNLTPVTVGASTTGSQNLMSYVIPAGSMNAVGKMLRFTLGGSMLIPAAGVSELILLNFSAGSGGGQCFTVQAPASIPVGPVQAAWSAVIELVTVTAGSAGILNMTSHSAVEVTAGNNWQAIVSLGGFGQGSATDLTVAQTMQIACSFGTASLSNSMTQNEMIVEALN